jgi:hypothetical protein
MGPFIAEWWYLIAGGLLTLGLAVWLGLAEVRDANELLGVATGWGLVVALAASPFAIVAVGTAKAEVLWQLYLVFLGVVLLLAYFQPQHVFVLRGFQRVSEVVFFPGSKVWLLVLGTLLVGAGLYGFVFRYVV